jgi:cytochrome c553
MALPVGLLACCIGLGSLSAQPGPDPTAVFRLGDTNRDGKLTREEFQKLAAQSPRLKDNAELAKQIFDRLDANRDGSLSLDEYKKVNDLRGPMPPAEQKPEPTKPAPAADKPASAEQLAFFEKKIRPVLVAQCYQCHSADAEKIKGELVLDTRAGIRKGGTRGPSVVPGNLQQSLLIKAIKHLDEEYQMPPKQKLSGEIIADFEKWVTMGAPDPRDGAAKAAHHEIDIEKGRQFWAFQPPKKHAAPTPKDAAWARSDIDRFLLAALEAKGLKPVGDADRRTLLRRVYLDLTGLPPTLEEVEAFVTDPSPQAYAAAVDKLLDSPRFGERWGRHWLDVARYAESSGKAANFSYPHAWRYRDYVIAAFNADKPFDQFIKEQLAGDLLRSDDPKVKAERLVATGFLALGPKTLNERNAVQFELDVADEQIDVTTQAFLGITAACARCHDHKFDPIPQKDYYALAGIFRSTETCYGTVRFVQSQRPSPLIDLPKDSAPSALTSNLTDKERADIEKTIADLQERMKNAKDPIMNIFTSAQLALSRSKLDTYQADGTPKLLAMGVREKSGGGFGGFGQRGPMGPMFAGFGGTRTISDSPLYARGEPDKPSTDRVPRGTLQVMAKSPLRIPNASSGRLQLAEWIASKDNPLTARVLVNRAWLHLFGRGLVPTADNFGAAGQPPTNPELLDHLALTFMDDGWSVKKLIKRIVHSHAYQLDSKFDKASFEIDPENALIWRMSPRRLDAESLRDSMLAVSGQLNTTPPVGSVVARNGEGPVQRFGLGNNQLATAVNDPRNATRSVYLPILRDNLPEALSLFDAPDPSLIAPDRPTTTVPAQGLFLLNNPFVIRAAETTAEKLHKASGTESDGIRSAYLMFFGRTPSEKELAGAESFLKAYKAQLTKDRVSSFRQERDAWTAFAQALFASAEFQYRR